MKQMLYLIKKVDTSIIVFYELKQTHYREL